MERSQLATLNVTKTFATSGEDVLSGITVSFAPGQTAAIVGVSGTGKSTFMHLLAGIDVPTSGIVTFDGVDLQTFTPAQRASFLGGTVGLMFQSPHLLRELCVRENVMLPGLVRHQSLAQCQMRADDLLDAVGLAHKAESKPASLSGGQQQRVALARALFGEPKFLLADEPTGNLDEETGAAVIDLLMQLQQQHGMGIVVSTHDMQVADRMQKTYRMHEGTLSRV